MFYISVNTNVKEFRDANSALVSKQIPYATAFALSELAKLVKLEETANMRDVLDRPRPFTTGAIGTVGASKANLQALVYVKDTTAEYLKPYEFGGLNKLNSRALLKPVGAMDDLDEFGNLPQTYLRKLVGMGGSVLNKDTGLLERVKGASFRSDVFIGKVKTKRGIVSGVWQRTADSSKGPAKPAKLTRLSANGRITTKRVAGYVPTRDGQRLKLLVRFTDAHPISEKNHLDWFKVAEKVVAENFDHQFQWAMARALATAK